MVLNSGKCKLISFTRKQSNSDFPYVINNSAISRVQSFKYLGINLTHNLSWHQHITAICAKASQTLGYTRRNLRKSPPNIRKLAYLTFIRPQLEFASSIWSPHQDYLITNLELVQNRAARFITGNYERKSSITKMKLEHSLHPLQVRRYVSLLCLLHGYIHNTRPHSLPLKTPLRMSRRLHNQDSFERIFGKTRAFCCSALPHAVKLWNDLPGDIASITNRKAFHDRLLEHFMLT